MSRYIVLGSWLVCVLFFPGLLTIAPISAYKTGQTTDAFEAPTFVVLISFATLIRATPCPGERHGIH
ncbi:hypothetical protein GE21DRAFT_1277954 [Neurospora crassa]|nr:hypothetical protein GE21DRAFT_1277954 [Neurospora crassa]